jgi:hypothetical protein
MPPALKLIEREENAPQPLTGNEVLWLISDLIAEHLPSIPFDDPYCGTLRTLHELGKPGLFGRPV